MSKNGHVVIIDNVRSALNVGAIFRTSSGLGISKVFLCGITPTPYDPKGKKRRDFVKTALGSEDEIPWESAAFPHEVVSRLKREGYTVVAIEQDKASVDYKSLAAINNVSYAIVVGSEVDGVSQEVLKSADVILEVPMLGLKESLNVTIAFAVVAYRLLDK